MNYPAEITDAMRDDLVTFIAEKYSIRFKHPFETYVDYANFCVTLLAERNNSTEFKERLKLDIVCRDYINSKF